MSHLQLLRGRRAGVKTTQKIINAMRMIAISRMKKIQPIFEQSRAYKTEWSLLMQQALKHIQGNETMRTLQGDPESEHVLFILLGANRGLCGSFNSQFQRFVQENYEGASLHSDVDAIVFGSKLHGFVDKSDIHMKSFYHALDIPSLGDVRRYVHDILHCLQKKPYREVFLLYTQFHTLLHAQPVIKTLLPLSYESTGSPSGEVYQWEPPVEDMLATMLEHYYIAVLYEALLSQSLCEQAARMQAMDTASSNAQELVERLTLEYNRQRQDNITGELMEIISGAEFMKEIHNAH